MKKPTMAVVVLAAGESRRFGRLKQLLPWGDGEGTLLSHAVDVALASQAHSVVVVLGHQAEACRAALADQVLSSLAEHPVAQAEWTKDALSDKYGPICRPSGFAYSAASTGDRLTVTDARR